MSTFQPAFVSADIDEAGCALLQRAVELAGRKWNGAILLAVWRGAHRFSEMRAAIPEISARLLSARLQELEHHGLIARDVIASHPVQIRYTLTERGAELVRVLTPLVPWASRWGLVAEHA